MVNPRLSGDVCGYGADGPDGLVNVIDLTRISVAYGNLISDPWGLVGGYNPDADLNADDIVDMQDLQEAAYALGHTDTHVCINADPLLWKRVIPSPLPKTESWSAGAHWFNDATPETPDVWQWWDARGNTGTDQHWFDEPNLFQEEPTRGIHGKMRIFGGGYRPGLPFKLPASLGVILIEQGKRLGCSTGAYEFPSYKTDYPSGYTQEARIKFKYNFSGDMPDWIGLVVGCWGYLAQGNEHGCGDTDGWQFIELMEYVVLGGSTGVMCPEYYGLPSWVPTCADNGSQKWKIFQYKRKHSYALNQWHELTVPIGEVIAMLPWPAYINGVYVSLELGNGGDISFENGYSQAELWVEHAYIYFDKLSATG